MRWRLILLAFGLATPLQAGGPIAEVICAPRPDLVERLMRGHEAALVGRGVRDVDAVMEIWASPRGDWMLVQSHPDGQACLLAMGEAWDSVPAKLPQG